MLESLRKAKEATYDDVINSIIDYLEEVINLEDCLGLLGTDLQIAKQANDAYFEAKEKEEA